MDAFIKISTGALCGLAATLPMSLWMWLASKRGWLVEQAPQTVTRRTTEQSTGKRPPPKALDLMTSAVHLGIGAGLGGLFGLLVGGRRISSPVAGALGVGYGLIVWLTSYAAILPAFDLMPPPTHDQRRRPQAMIVAHVIFGGVLGVLVSVVRRSVR